MLPACPVQWHHPVLTPCCPVRCLPTDFSIIHSIFHSFVAHKMSIAWNLNIDSCCSNRQRQLTAESSKRSNGAVHVLLPSLDLKFFWRILLRIFLLWLSAFICWWPQNGWKSLDREWFTSFHRAKQIKAYKPTFKLGLVDFF